MWFDFVWFHMNEVVKRKKIQTPLLTIIFMLLSVRLGNFALTCTKRLLHATCGRLFHNMGCFTLFSTAWINLKAVSAMSIHIIAYYLKKKIHQDICQESDVQNLNVADVSGLQCPASVYDSDTVIRPAAIIILDSAMP